MAKPLPNRDGVTLDHAVRAFLAANKAARGMTLDLNYAGGAPEAERYAAVVRVPDNADGSPGYVVLGYYASPFTAAAEIEKFWDGMAQLFAPA